MNVGIEALSRTAARLRILRPGNLGLAAILSLCAGPTPQAGTVIVTRCVSTITVHHRCGGPGCRLPVGRRPHTDRRDGHRQRDRDEMPHGQRRGAVDPGIGTGSGDRHSAASRCLYRYGQTSLCFSDRRQAAARSNGIVSRSQLDPAQPGTVQVRGASLQQSNKRSVVQ